MEIMKHDGGVMPSHLDGTTFVEYLTTDGVNSKALAVNLHWPEIQLYRVSEALMLPDSAAPRVGPPDDMIAHDSDRRPVGVHRLDTVVCVNLLTGKEIPASPASSINWGLVSYYRVQQRYANSTDPDSSDVEKRRQKADRRSENSGGNVDYYRVHIECPNQADAPYMAECSDIIEALDMTFNEGEEFKATWRGAAQRTLGIGKLGDDYLRNAEKRVHFSARDLALAKHRKNSKK